MQSRVEARSDEALMRVAITIQPSHPCSATLPGDAPYEVHEGDDNSYSATQSIRGVKILGSDHSIG